MEAVMQIVMPKFLPALPEIFLLSMACVVLVLDLFLTERYRVVTYGLSQFTLLITALLAVVVYPGKPTLDFGGLFILDGMAVVLKIAICLVSIWVFVYSRAYLSERALFKGEYYVLGLFGILGMLVMVSAHSLLTVYLGLELLSLSLYAMVAFHRDNTDAAEAAMKYFVLGALASGMLLYGMSMIYGSTGSLAIADIGARVASAPGNDLVLVFGLVFLVVGLAFKFGAVPFHMWLPDVYQGAPTAVTLYLSAAPKIAAFAMAMRLLSEGMGTLYTEWRDMLVILAVLSLAVGNVIAIAQTNIKRMLAYSTISHVGFLLLGVLAATDDGYAAAMFYVVTYAIMAMGAFGIVLLLSRAGFEAENLDDYKGLNDRSPWFALMMLILMFSMAGVPLTVGFFAKLQVIQAVVQVDMVWLAVVAVLFSVIGAYYYLRIVKLMYFDKPEGELVLQGGADMRAALSVNGLAVLVLGIFPGWLIAVCQQSFG